MAASRVFTSFDFDHDEDLRNLLIGQSKNPDSPFQLADWSVKEHMSGDWKEKVRKRIRSVDQVVVICGEYTHTATGVSIELKIAQEEGLPYFLLNGRRDKACTKPTSASSSDKIYSWTWANLKKLIGGGAVVSRESIKNEILSRRGVNDASDSGVIQWLSGL